MKPITKTKDVTDEYRNDVPDYVRREGGPMRVKGRFSPTIGQALKILICAMFRIEVYIQIVGKVEILTDN